MSALPSTVDDQELRRLARLKLLAVLDTGPEPAFDALVRTAAAVCGKPIALLTLIDEHRQWFKANVGMPGATETPRDVAFCNHAIRDDALLQVQDATRDERFRANPFVTGDPGIRFYAGAPIIMPGGERVGTLCVVDSTPGALSPQQQDLLRDLADVAQILLLQRERLQALNLDATGLRKAGRAHQQSYALLASVVQALPCGLAVFDGESRLVVHNQEFLRLLDVPDEMIARRPTFADFVRLSAQRGEYGPGDVETQVEDVLKLARAGQQLNRERPDGTSLDIRSAGLPEGGMILTYLDLSSVKSAERALRYIEERKTRALDASRLTLWELDLSSGWLYLSENWSLLLGGPAVPTITTPTALNELVPEEKDRAALRTALWDTIRGAAESYTVEHPVRRLDGSLAWIRSEGRVSARDADGKAIYATGTTQDITVRKQAEAELARFASISHATVEAATDGILVSDADGKVLLKNRRLLKMWGIPQHMENADVWALARHVHEQVVDPEAFMRRIEAMRAAGDSESFDVLQFHDGRVFERYVQPLTLGGHQPGLVWSFHDVTAQRAAARELQEAKEAAEAANRAKSDFLDNVSHEIRTPLNGVLGLTRLLLAEQLTPQQRQYVELADASASSLLGLINDLLDLGKIEAGRMELDDAPFRLDELLAQLGDLYRLRAREKGLRFELEVASEVPAGVCGDAGRLRQVLNNLLSNALKFTERGEFGLLVSRAEPGRGSDVLRFTVYDTGVGIPYETQQRLFTRFTQGEQSTSRKYGGTGLGLAIVKQLCVQMGGRVFLQSEPGRGASFRCELPLKAAALPASATPAAAPAAGPPSQPTRILVAEDNPTNQVVVRGLLAQAGYRNVTLVDDGQQAVDAALANDYDLVLMDCRMPVLDGYAASTRLRARGFTAPIIALTANAAAGERERCLAHGMSDYLAKPVDPARLAQVLAEWTLASDARPAPPPAMAASGIARFERNQSLERLGGDEELLAVAIESFREHAPKVLAAARAALAAGDQAVLHRHLHSLAGSSGMVGAEPLRELAKALELQAQAGQLQGLDEGVAALAALLEEFQDASATW